jgi:hypothetical protein
MSGPFDKELESIANAHTQDFARKLAQEVAKLILRKLGIDGAKVAGPAKVASASKKKGGKGAAAAGPAKGSPAKKAAPAPKSRPNGEDRAVILDKVFKIVSSREGVAVGEVVKATSLERGPVAAALKTLKEEGKIFMGGDRRFARYAMSQATADRASETARKG